MNKAELKQFSRRTAVGIRVEPVREIDQVRTDGHRVDRKRPRGHAEAWHRGAQGTGQQRVLERLAPTQQWVHNGHHPVTGA